MNRHINWVGKKILVVEDDDANFLYIAELFKSYRAKIIRSIDGLDAFFICMTEPPDLVIMDIMLPVLNGCESMRLIKKYQPKIPIITLSACAMPDDRNKSEIAGSDAFIAKPVFPNDLIPVANYFIMYGKNVRTFEFN